jgi:hypothetical protein
MSRLFEDDRDIGVIVSHFKRETVDIKERPDAYLYKILAIGADTDTLEEKVVYESLEDGRVWVRPREQFYSEVDKKKYPDVTQKYRFEALC